MGSQQPLAREQGDTMLKGIIYDWALWSLLVSAIAGYFLGARPKPNLMTLYSFIGHALSILAFIYGIHAALVLGSMSFILTLGFPFALGGFIMLTVDEINGGRIGRMLNEWAELRFKGFATP